MYAKKITDIVFPEGASEPPPPSARRVTTLTEYRYDGQGNPTRTSVKMTSWDGERHEKSLSTSTVAPSASRHSWGG